MQGLVLLMPEFNGVLDAVMTEGELRVTCSERMGLHREETRLVTFDLHKTRLDHSMKNRLLST